MVNTRSHHAALTRREHHNKHKSKWHQLVHHATTFANHAAAAYSYRQHMSGPRSKTSTKKEERIHGDDVHSGLTSTGYSIVVNPHWHKHCSSTAFQYIENYTGFLTSTSGQGQQVKTLAVVGHVNQAMLPPQNSTIHFNSPNIPTQPYYNLNPNAHITGSGLFSSSTKDYTAEKIFMSNVGIDLRVANFSTVGAEVDIYVLKTIADGNDFPDALWSQATSNQSLNQPYATQPAAGAGTGNVVGAMNNGIVGNNPQAYRDFKKCFKVLKVHHINLGAAAEEKIHFHVKMNLLIDFAKMVDMNPGYTNDPATWTQGNTTLGWVKGSLSIMVVCHGALAMNQDTPVGLPVFNTAELGFAVTKHHYFRTIEATAQNLDTIIYDSQIPAVTLAPKSVNILDAIAASISA